MTRTRRFAAARQGASSKSAAAAMSLYGDLNTGAFIRSLIRDANQH